MYLLKPIPNGECDIALKGKIKDKYVGKQIHGSNSPSGYKQIWDVYGQTHSCQISCYRVLKAEMWIATTVVMVSKGCDQMTLSYLANTKT